MTTLNYGETTFEVESLSDQTRHVLMQRGLSHILGNEVASKVTAWVKRNTTDAAPATDKTPAVVASAPTEAQIAAFKAEAFANAVAAITGGTLGEASARGPRGPADPVGNIALDLAKADVMAAAAKRNFKLSAKDIAEKAKTILEKRSDHYRSLAAKQLAKAGGGDDMDALFA